MYPNQPPQGYAPPMPQYPQQPPAYPAAPPAPQYPPQPGYPQGYAQPVPQYPPAPQYAPPAPPAVPLPTGTLDSFYEQPSSGGGPAFKFRDASAQPLIGKTYAGLVERPVTNADVRAQTDNSGRPMTYRDGRPKFVLVVPMLVQPSQEFPDGRAGWWVKGQARDELARAMAEAGAPEGPPEAGAGIVVQLVSVRPIPNMSPAYQYRITYTRPHGAPAAPPAQPAQPVVAAPVAPAQFPQHIDQQGQAHYAQPVPPAQPVYVQPMPVAAAQPAPVVAQPVMNTAAAAAPTGLSPEQADLLARLTGAQPVPQG